MSKVIGIHPIHRRLAELHIASKNRKLKGSELADARHCLEQNATLILKLDWLKELSFMAYILGDTDWHHDICARIEEIERTLNLQQEEER